MPTIHDKAWAGTLDEDDLEECLADNPAAINLPGGRKNMTPLAAACLRGHRDIVELLLLNPKVKVNALSPKNRTALFHATSRPKRHAIVRLLLGKKPDVDLEDENGNTPLMNAIAQSREIDVIHELVDHGADISRPNRKGQSAKSLAATNKIEQELKLKKDRSSIAGAIVDVIVSVVLLIVAYTNNNVIKGVMGNIVQKLYHISGAENDELAKDINKAQPPPPTAPGASSTAAPPPVPLTAETFKANIGSYVADKGLERFFKPGDPFLQNLAEKAMALSSDRSTDLSLPENIKRLTTLSLYRPILYCDDSSSMSTGNRLANQRELVTRIARIATRIVPDGHGVDLCFINNNGTFSGSAKDIEVAVKAVQPSRGTRLGNSLRQKILKPFVYDFISAPGGYLRRPVLVCIITDGAPSGEPEGEFKSEIIKCRQTLVEHGYEPDAVMFCINQIGDDRNATRFLKVLREDQTIDDVLYCTTDRLDSGFEDIQENERKLEVWLLKLLTRPIMDNDVD